MLKPIAAIRRKASFREQRKPKIPVTPVKNSNKRPPSIELDNYFSIDSFLARIKPNRKSSQPPTPLPKISVSTKASTSSLTSACLLDELPENCLKQIFTNLDPPDLQNVRLICNRFDSIISSSNLIQRKSINTLQLNGTSRGRIYRFSHRNAPLYDRYGYYQSEIEKGLKFLISKKIIFDNVFIDASVAKALLTGIDYCVEEIVFDFCHFQLSADAFSHLIKNWKPKRISVINCDWREAGNTALINDSLFCDNSRLEKFVFSTVGSKKILISDQIFHHFSNSCYLPQTLEFNGCETKITLNGIRNAVKEYFIACRQALKNPSTRPAKTTPIKWNFGRIYPNSAEILSTLEPFLPHAKVMQTEYPIFEIRFRPTKSFPLLCLSLYFLHPEPFNSSISDISWDDSDE